MPDMMSPSQMPLSDPATLEPFVDRFAQEVARQENALHQPPSRELQDALMRVRQTWYERHRGFVLLGAGVVGGLLFFRVVR